MSCSIRRKIGTPTCKSTDLDEIIEHLAGGPHVQRLDTIDSSLKELIYQLLDTGIF